MKPLTDKDISRDNTHNILTKLKSKENPPEARSHTIANLNLGCINEASDDDPKYRVCIVCIIRRCRPNVSLRGMYEHVREILKHNISLNLIKENILTTFQLNSNQE